ncbi:hypothetical protein [Kouleothrix sp.]|uniref:hypothetical protein n=1 Tax=Kouleothrix sp. TaxID=2779161 RepID=UPI003919F6B6
MSSADMPLAIQPRYTRSIHLQRDYADHKVGINDYQATPLVLQTIERIMQGLAPESRARAFSLIGPYGSGKSAFAVFLAHYLSNSHIVRQRLIAKHSTEGIPEHTSEPRPMLLPLLVSGNNDSLRQAVVQQLKRLFETMEVFRNKKIPFVKQLVDAAIDPDIDPQQVADLLAEACVIVRKRTAFAGIALMIDELGQFLDYAARQGDDRDLFVLQTLAEMAARSAETPCIILTILHQSFDSYVGAAGATRRAEWAKVQGRFADLLFQEPPIQMLRIVAHALFPETKDPFVAARRRWAEKVAPLGEKLGLRPPDVSNDEWHSLIAHAYPLHPTVLVALPLLFRQLAQNERSLFAFLTSRESWSIQDFLATERANSSELPIYRLPHLYSYIHATLGASLFGRARGQRWAELAEARAQLPATNGILLDVLTAIGTLGALGQVQGLQANAAQVAFALCDQIDDVAVEGALQELQTRKHIAFRQYSDSFVIWEGSDLDIDGMTQIARREVGDRVTLVKLLQEYSNSVPLVARRHSYETGAVRYFSVRFIDAIDLTDTLEITQEADGEVLYVVAADEEALSASRVWATRSERTDDIRRVVVLPQRVRELRDLLLDVAALEHVLDNQQDLEGDRAARRELSSRLIEARQYLATAIAETYGPGWNQWYWRGQTVGVRTARQIDDLLSSACDTAYNATPRIWNELIVRRQLSSAAAKARRNLIEAMLDHAQDDVLGISGYPPERAIYESVLRSTGIHRQEADGIWRFGLPPMTDPFHVIPVWNAIQQFIDATESQPQLVSELYKLIEAPPFGIKAGLLPLLVMAVYMANISEITWYEHGNYVTMPDTAMFERLQRQPGYFAIRRSRVTGARVVIYERLARALAPRALTKPAQLGILDAVTPLLRRIGSLPAYSRTTRRISQRAQAIRQAILDARAPDELLFEKLPMACDQMPFVADAPVDEQQVEMFFAELNAGLQELQDAYARLLVQVGMYIRNAFGVSISENDMLRAQLTERYRAVADVTSDSQVRAVGVRLENAEPGGAWIESVAALVGHKPLDSWNDADLSSFELNITDLGRRFRRIEDVAVASHALSPDTSLLRVGITNGKGEVSTVVQVKKRHLHMQQLYDELRETLARYDTLSMEDKVAILAELLQPELQPTLNGNGNHE